MFPMRHSRARLPCFRSYSCTHVIHIWSGGVNNFTTVSIEYIEPTGSTVKITLVGSCKVNISNESNAIEFTWNILNGRGSVDEVLFLRLNVREINSSCRKAVKYSLGSKVDENNSIVFLKGNDSNVLLILIATNYGSGSSGNLTPSKSVRVILDTTQ